MDPELKASRISLPIHAAAAIIFGYVSFRMGNNLLSGFLGIIVLIITGFAVERIVKKKGIKWWLANGLFVYLFLWLVSWVYFFNLPA